MATTPQPPRDSTDWKARAAQLTPHERLHVALILAAAPDRDPAALPAHGQRTLAWLAGWDRDTVDGTAALLRWARLDDWPDGPEDPNGGPPRPRAS